MFSYNTTGPNPLFRLPIVSYKYPYLLKVFRQAKIFLIKVSGKKIHLSKPIYIHLAT